jgi:DNA-binding response OmpR family regulator
VLFFAVALCMGHLTTRLRIREIAERRRQLETDALLRLTQSAALAPETDKGLAEALRISDSVVDAQRQLLREVWGPQGDGQTHYLRVYANHLRKKLGDLLVISNEPGIGYRLLDPTGPQ